MLDKRKLLALGIVGGVSTLIDPSYLYRDFYSTDNPGPITSPLPCEPGPGRLVLGSSLNSISSIVSGELYVNGTPVSPFNTLMTEEYFHRKGGRLFHLKLTTPTTMSTSRIGWGDDLSNVQIGFVRSSGLLFPQFGNNVPMAGYSISCPNTVVDFYAIMTSNGGHLLADVAGTLKLLWTSRVGSLDCYGKIWCRNVAIQLKTDDWEVYDLAAPYIDDYGLATAIVVSPSAGETIATATADGMHEITWTPGAAETLLFMFRRTDDDNCLKVYCDQATGKISIYKRVAGTDTALWGLINQTWTVGTPYRIVIRADGSSILVSVGDTVGAFRIDETYNQTVAGIKVSLGGSNLISWPLVMPPFY